MVEADCRTYLYCPPMAFSGAHLVGVDGSKVQNWCAREHSSVDAEFHVSRLEDILSMRQTKDLPEANLIVCSAVIHHVSG